MSHQFKWLLCIAVSTFWIGCNKQSVSPPKPIPKPFVVNENDGIVHELYRGISFEEFTPTLPSGSLDAIDMDMTIDDYVIALVTAEKNDDEPGPEFVTSFSTDEQQTIDKRWQAASGNKRGSVRGLFLIPNTVTSAKTLRAAARTVDKNDLERRASGD